MKKNESKVFILSFLDTKVNITADNVNMTEIVHVIAASIKKLCKDKKINEVVIIAQLLNVLQIDPVSEELKRFIK
jgi:hypothetical protein